MYSYSKKTNAFYIDENKEGYAANGTLPDDLIIVSDETFAEYSQQKAGYIRAAGSDGFPSWLTVPPPSIEDQIGIEEERKRSYTALATAKIGTLQDAVDLEIATAEESADLKKWKTYRVYLNRVDTSKAPDIDWPVMPG